MGDSSRSIRIGETDISDDSVCYVIAEVGHNHQGSLEQCKRMFDEARRCGADAVKLQKRDNRSLFTAAFFNKPYDNPNSFGPTYGEHREALEFGYSEYFELREYAREIGLCFFATAFDIPSAEFLAELEMPAYKIASADITNLPLIRHVAAIGRPMIMSTGGAEMDDVRRGFETAAALNDQVALLQCTAGYPAAWEELDLRVIQTFRAEFPDAVIGLSSHDNGIAMPVVAFTLGARIVEKHFTLDRAMRGSDHAFSLEPQGLRKMVRDLRRTHVALGSHEKRCHDSEVKPILKMAKKLVAARDLPAGHVLQEDDLAVKSPADGIPPSRLEEFVGCALNTSLARDTTLQEEHVGERKLAKATAAPTGNGKRKRRDQVVAQGRR
jgi:N-acetylneuraminate synthase/sialic acid synthase